jgi:hypothetical protein
MLSARAGSLLATAWIALWLALLAPAMCQRHGLLYFHAHTPNSLPEWADEDMCGDPSAPVQSSAADHHTGKAFQTNLALTFVIPETTFGIEAAPFVTALTLDDQTAESFALAPLPPPPRLSDAQTG